MSGSGRGPGGRLRAAAACTRRLAAAVAALAFAHLPAAGAAAHRHVVWTQSVADLESLARAALPVKLDIGGGWTGLSLVIEEASDFHAGPGRLSAHLRGHTEPLAVAVETDVDLRLRFDRLKGVHVVELQSMPVTVGVLGKIDLARTLGPWQIEPDHLHKLNVEGSAGLGIKTTIRVLELSEDGLRAELDLHYFRPPAE